MSSSSGLGRIVDQMRILIVVADGSPGGGTTHVLQLLENMSNFACLALLADTGSYIVQRARALGIEVLEDRMFGSRFSQRSVRAVRQAVQTFNPDVVHAHGGRANFYVRQARIRKPVVYTVHGFHHRKKGALGRFLGAAAEKFGISGSACVVFVCQHDREVAIKERLMSPAKSHRVIYNGIVLPAASVAAGQKSWGNRVGFIGRLVPQKHPELFLHILKEMPDTFGVMIGGGESFESLRQLALNLGVSQRIEFTGAVSRERVLESLPRLDCLVMTSRWEGLPILPLEAMWCGVPVVSTAVGGMPEVLVSGESGMLIDSESPDDFVEAISRLREDYQLRRAVIESARTRVRTMFSEQAMIEQLRDIYNGIVQKTAVPFNDCGKN